MSAPARRAGPPTSELHAAVEEALGRTRGREVHVRSLERRAWPYTTSFPVEELHVTLQGGESLRLIFKDLARVALDWYARLAKPEFLHDPLREAAVYSRVLASKDLGTATYHGASIDSSADRYWLFIEKVDGVELYQVGDVATWKAVARWLARMHSRLVGEVERYAQEGRLLRHDPVYYRRWIGRARDFAHAAPRSRPERRRIDWLAERYDAVVERLAGLQVTVIHGEFYASNVLVSKDEEELRVCPIDWEVAAVAPGPIDLGALVTGWWPEDRAAIERAYRDALGDDYRLPDGDAGFREALAACRLHLAVQWLGWAPRDWIPPGEHRRDWLSEAIQAAEELRL